MALPTLTPQRRGPARPGPGTQPAGHVLVVMVGALVLAAVVNADALVERAERKPIGDERDRALAIWHPVQDVGGILQLTRIRAFLDATVEDGDAPAPVVAAGGGPEGPTATTLPPRPDLRQPTASAPLRMLVAGDSIVRDFGESLVRDAEETGLIAATLHYEISSGLTRPDYYDWPAALAADLSATDAEVVVAMFGANDAQGIIEPDGTVHEQVSTPGWQAEYGRRVGAAMDLLGSGGRLVYWVGQPAMRDRGFDDRIRILNRVYEAQAQERPWVVFVDARAEFVDAAGNYADYLPDASGQLVDLRQGDGIHLTRAGSDRLSGVVLRLLAEEVDLRPAPAPTTTATTAP